MDLNSPEIQKLLAAVADRTEKGDITWEVLEYDPIGFMTEMGVEFDGSETENFAQHHIPVPPAKGANHLARSL